MHDPRHKPETLVNVGYVAIRDRDPSYRIVICQGSLRALKPVDGKNDVRINHRDELTTCLHDTPTSGVTPASVLLELNELQIRIVFSNICHYLRSAVARAIIYYDDLMLTEALELVDRSHSTLNVSCFIVRDYNKTDQDYRWHLWPSIQAYAILLA
jgi:hypothetical protein